MQNPQPRSRGPFSPSVPQRATPYHHDYETELRLIAKWRPPRDPTAQTQFVQHYWGRLLTTFELANEEEAGRLFITNDEAERLRLTRRLVWLKAAAEFEHSRPRLPGSVRVHAERLLERAREAEVAEANEDWTTLRFVVAEMEEIRHRGDLAIANARAGAVGRPRGDRRERSLGPVGEAIKQILIETHDARMRESAILEKVKKTTPGPVKKVVAEPGRGDRVFYVDANGCEQSVLWSSLRGRTLTLARDRAADELKRMMRKR